MSNEVQESPASAATEQETFAQEANRERHIREAMSRALDASPIKHVGERRTAVLALMEKMRNAGATFKVSDSGRVRTELNGKQVALGELATDMLLIGELGDRDSVAEALKDKTSITVRSKSDLTTPKEKASFVSAFGFDVWEALPMKREIAPDQIEFKSDLKTLAEKTAWISEHSFEAFEALPLRRPQE
jgi:hypothetical protein